MASVTDLLFLQPVLSGRSHLSQFLRLKSAEAMLEGSAKEGITSRLRKELESGSSIEIAGYRLNPEVAAGIDAAELLLPDRYPGRIYWLECETSAPATISPASTRKIDALATAGRSIAARAVSGPSFWQTVEIEESPALIQATIEILRAPAGAESATV